MISVRYYAASKYTYSAFANEPEQVTGQLRVIPTGELKLHDRCSSVDMSAPC